MKTQVLTLLCALFLMAAGLQAQTMGQGKVITSALAGTYTIGADADYDSFSAAITDLKSLGVSAAVTFLVNPGIYTEQLWLTEIEGISEQNTITFQSAEGIPEDVVLQYSPQSLTTNWVVHLQGIDYITFQGMTIQNTEGTEYGKVIALSGINNHISILDNILNGIYIDFPMDMNKLNDYSIIFSKRGTGDLCNYALIQNNVFNNGSTGITVEGEYGGAMHIGNKIIGNTMTGFYYTGIYLNRQDAPHVNQNVLTGSELVVNEIEGIKIERGINGLEIQQNQIFLQSPSQNYGIQVWYFYSDAANPGLIANNYICLTESSWAVKGIGIMQGGSQYLYHNTIRILEVPGTVFNPAKGWEGCLYVEFWDTQAGNGNIRAFNNIITNEGQQYPLIATSIETIQNGYLISDYNCFFTQAPVFAEPGNTQLASLEAWVSQVGMDVNSIAADPAFVSLTDPTPENPLLGGFAPLLPLVPDDLYMQPRKPEGTAPGAVEIDDGTQQQITQNVAFAAGWSSLSSYLVPSASALENVFAPISGELIIAQTMTGFYYPAENTNTIGNWPQHAAFIIKTGEPCTLPILGTIEENRSLVLATGWNLMPVLSQDPTAIEDLFPPEKGTLIIIKEVAGTGICWPAMEVNSIETLQPGKAYLVKVAEEITIEFPE